MMTLLLTLVKHLVTSYLYLEIEMLENTLSGVSFSNIFMGGGGVSHPRLQSLPTPYQERAYTRPMRPPNPKPPTFKIQVQIFVPPQFFRACYRPAISRDLGLVCSLRSQSCQVLKFPTSEMLAADGAKGTSVLCFLCWRRQRLLRGSGGMLPRKMFEIRWKCTVEFAILVFFHAQAAC